ncbi:hypothetical protein Lalb_Chr21g0305621 [Lupinus albus]|uniref:Uncharacterized protein n=1 Tax=Lupinus albus TaxID=3870 RepID=A0A6A4NNE0_LUPAL|nr:hypothetical protein Lalb_Chr21g0305621 [Lupinus albus]
MKETSEDENWEMKMMFSNRMCRYMQHVYIFKIVNMCNLSFHRPEQKRESGN